jgi:hypothetical protein
MSNEKIVATRQHNVYCACTPESETSERVVKAVPHPALQLLIDQLIRKRPRWHYILKGHASMAEDGQDGYFRHYMRITEDGEQLGEVSVEKHWRTNAIIYEIDNVRIRNGRQRSGAAKTIKPSEAVKAIIKNFAAKTIDELLQTANGSVNAAVGAVYAKARDKVHYVVANLRDELFYLVASNPTLMQQITFHDETKDERIRKLPNLYAEKQMAQAVYDKYQQKDGNIVMLRGDKLWVCAANDLTNHMSYTYETAPKHILLAVAMLKVAEKGEVIEGIGTRADAEHFYVVNPQVHDE